jgi:hypothetical protein
MLKTDIMCALRIAWAEYEVEHGIDSLSEKWMAAQGGVPALIVELPTEHDITLPPM